MKRLGLVVFAALLTILAMAKAPAAQAGTPASLECAPECARNTDCVDSCGFAAPCVLFHGCRICGC